MVTLYFLEEHLFPLMKVKFLISLNLDDCMLKNLLKLLDGVGVLPLFYWYNFVIVWVVTHFLAAPVDYLPSELKWKLSSWFNVIVWLQSLCLALQLHSTRKTVPMSHIVLTISIAINPHHLMSLFFTTWVDPIVGLVSIDLLCSQAAVLFLRCSCLCGMVEASQKKIPSLHSVYSIFTTMYINTA